jgi:hypothetical protein
MMAAGKQINFVVSNWMYDRLLDEKEKGKFGTMTELLEECIRYYLDKEKHAEFQKNAIIDYLKSDDGRLWFSALLDEELLRRAMPKRN